MEISDIEAAAMFLANSSRGLTLREIRELKGGKRVYFPYEDVVKVLDELGEDELDKIPEIIKQAELSVYRRCSYKRLYREVHSKIVKDWLKPLQ